MSKKNRFQLELECLGTRNLLSAGVIQNHLGAVVIRGTRDGDSADVTDNGTTIDVAYNGVSYSFNASSVKKLVFRGKSGDDTFANGTNVRSLAVGGQGADDLQGGDADDTLNGGAGDDTVNGGAGEDECHGDAGNDDVDGGEDNDDVTGGAGDDLCDGGGGDDDVDGDQGQDEVSGGEGNDDCYGGAGDDDVYGDDGEDLVAGDQGSDVCHGGTGDDYCNGGGDDGDIIDGDEGDDTEAGGDCIDLDQTFEAEMAGDNDLMADAYFTTYVDDDVTETEFYLEVDCGPANETFDIYIDNILVGTITLDDGGYGWIEFSTEAGDDSVPFPDDFPAIDVGTHIDIGDVLHGEFAGVED